MSKTFAGICVGLLSLILIVQIITLFVSVRPKVTFIPMTSNAMIRNLEGESSFVGNPYSGFGQGGDDSSVSSSFCGGTNPGEDC